MMIVVVLYLNYYKLISGNFLQLDSTQYSNSLKNKTHVSVIEYSKNIDVQFELKNGNLEYIAHGLSS